MDQEDAAKTLRIKPGSLRSRLSRAKAALREQGEDDA
jgi:DNA-directed RNA polymerase specialized sigma24 family protein